MNNEPLTMNKKNVMKMHTTYMGLKLDSPIVVSACTLSEHTDNIMKMEDNGAGAVVLFSLFADTQRGSNIQQCNVGNILCFPRSDGLFSGAG